MPLLLVLNLSLLAGWIVNLAIDLIPQQRALRHGWLIPLARLAPDWFQSRSWLETAPWQRLRTLIVWVLAGGLTWLAFRQSGMGLEMMALCLYAWFLLAIAFIDLEHRLVLNRMLLAGLPLLLFGGLALGHRDPFSPLVGAAAGFLPFLALALVWPGAMGMGDVKLAGWIGLAVGYPGILPVLVIASASAGMAGLLLLIAHRFRRGVTFAYAPYLSFGAIIVLFVMNW